MVGTFPLSVQAGSPQYTTAGEITPVSSTTSITVTIPNTGSTDPISNAYYTIQNADGSKWCTFYVESWTNVGGFVPADAPVTYNLSCTYSSSNTSDVFPEGSLCWCVWCKEYYDSLTTPISLVNNEISTINNDISALTPKVDNSFVSATKTNDTTLRLTRNDGSTVDISFPEGVKYRKEVVTASPATYQSNSDELVICTGSRRKAEFSNKTLEISGYSLYGYIQVQYTSRNGPTTKVATRYTDPITLSDSISDFVIDGMLYDGAILTVKE